MRSVVEAALARAFTGARDRAEHLGERERGVRHATFLVEQLERRVEAPLVDCAHPARAAPRVELRRHVRGVKVVRRGVHIRAAAPALRRPGQEGVDVGLREAARAQLLAVGFPAAAAATAGARIAAAARVRPRGVALLAGVACLCSVARIRSRGGARRVARPLLPRVARLLLRRVAMLLLRRVAVLLRRVALLLRWVALLCIAISWLTMKILLAVTVAVASVAIASVAVAVVAVVAVSVAATAFMVAIAITVTVSAGTAAAVAISATALAQP